MATVGDHERRGHGRHGQGVLRCLAYGVGSVFCLVASVLCAHLVDGTRVRLAVWVGSLVVLSMVFGAVLGWVQDM